MDGKALQNLVGFLKERQGESGIVYCHKVSLAREGRRAGGEAGGGLTLCIRISAAHQEKALSRRGLDEASFGLSVGGVSKLDLSAKCALLHDYSFSCAGEQRNEGVLYILVVLYLFLVVWSSNLLASLVFCW